MEGSPLNPLDGTKTLDIVPEKEGGRAEDSVESMDVDNNETFEEERASAGESAAKAVSVRIRGVRVCVSRK